MTVRCPPLEWPAGLLEAGPPEDRSIVLRGEAMIAEARFTVMAVRVDPIRLGPDFRPGVPSAAYAEYALSGLLDQLSELVEISEAPTLRLSTGAYVMWMLPGGGAADVS
jgi:hypothetical protein